MAAAASKPSPRQFHALWLTHVNMVNIAAYRKEVLARLLVTTAYMLRIHRSAPTCAPSVRGHNQHTRNPQRPVRVQAVPGTPQEGHKTQVWWQKARQDLPALPVRLGRFLASTAQTAFRLHHPTLRQCLSSAAALLAVCCAFMAAVVLSQNLCLAMYHRLSGSHSLRSVLQPATG